MALRADRVAGEQVERDDLGRLAAERRLGVLADQHAGLVVVGGEQRVGGVDRVGRAVERDDQHALVARLLDRRDDGLGVAGRDQDGLGAGGDHVLHRGHLAGVVAVGLAGAGQQLGALGLGGGVGAFLHLHEERVGLGLGDQADHRLAPAAKAAPAASSRAAEAAMARGVFRFTACLQVRWGGPARPPARSPDRPCEAPVSGLIEL